jgi:hypothetical protein
MSKKVFFGQNDIRYYYIRYKESRYYAVSIFTTVIIACLLLVIGIIIPQANTYLSIRKQAIAKRAIIDNLNKNINFINLLDKTRLDNQFYILTLALPPDKDFTGILNSLSEASIRAGVTLSDFNFNVGKISSQSATPQVASGEADISASPTESVDLQSLQAGEENVISTTVVINGSIERVGLFLKEMEENLPLSEVVSVNSEKNSTTISIKFHYLPFPKVFFKEESLLEPFTAQEQEIIEKMDLWKPAERLDDPFTTGTNSALPLFE